jgi:hypothetical protein
MGRTSFPKPVVPRPTNQGLVEPRLVIRAPLVTDAPVADGNVAVGEYDYTLDVDFVGDANPGRMQASSFDRIKAPDDLSYRLSAAHTERSLFLAFVVRDRGEVGRVCDVVNLCINGDRVANDYSLPPARVYGPEGFKLQGGGLGRKWSRHCPNDAWKLGTRSTPDGYVVEFEIPLRLIDTQNGPGERPARTGDLLLFNVEVTDNDEDAAWIGDRALLWSDDPRLGLSYGGEAVWTVGLELAPDARAATPGQRDSEGLQPRRGDRP